MKKPKFSETHFVSILKQADPGVRWRTCAVRPGSVPPPTTGRNRSTAGWGGPISSGSRSWSGECQAQAQVCGACVGQRGDPGRQILAARQRPSLASRL